MHVSGCLARATGSRRARVVRPALLCWWPLVRTRRSRSRASDPVNRSLDVSATSYPGGQEGNVAAPRTGRVPARRGVVAYSPREVKHPCQRPASPARRAPATGRRRLADRIRNRHVIGPSRRDCRASGRPFRERHSYARAGTGGLARRSWAVARPVGGPVRSSHPRPVSRDRTRRSSSSGRWPGSRTFGVTATRRRRSAAPDRFGTDLQLDTDRQGVAGRSGRRPGANRHLGNELAGPAGHLGRAGTHDAPSGWKRADRRRPAAAEAGEGGPVLGDEGDHPLVSHSCSQL